MTIEVRAVNPDAVRAALDRQDLADLVSGLAAWLDDHAAPDPGHLFTRDVTVHTPGGVASGIEQVASQARRVHGQHETHHLSANVLCTFDDAGASVRATQIATFADADSGEPVSAVAEIYDLRAVRTPNGWRLSRVSARPVWRLATT
jgi:hypothetical protein